MTGQFISNINYYRFFISGLTYAVTHMKYIQIDGYSGIQQYMQ